MSITWVSYDTFIAMTPEQRARFPDIGIDLSLSPSRLNREAQADYDEEARAHGVGVAELLRTGGPQ